MMTTRFSFFYHSSTHKVVKLNIYWQFCSNLMFRQLVTLKKQYMSLSIVAENCMMHTALMFSICVCLSPSVMFWSTCELLWEWDCVAGIWRIPLSPGYQESWVCRVSGSAFALIAVTTGGGAFGNWLTWERKCRVGVGYETGHLLLVLKVRKMLQPNVCVIC